MDEDFRLSGKKNKQRECSRRARARADGFWNLTSYTYTDDQEQEDYSRRVRRARETNERTIDSCGSEAEEPLLLVLLLASGSSAAGDVVGHGEVLGDELARAAAIDLHPHAVRLVHLVVARRRRRVATPAAAGPGQLVLDAAHQPRQLPHRRAPPPPPPPPGPTSGSRTRDRTRATYGLGGARA